MLSFNSSLLQSRKCPILARISSYSEYKFIKALLVIVFVLLVIVFVQPMRYERLCNFIELMNLAEQIDIRRCTCVTKQSSMNICFVHIEKDYCSIGQMFSFARILPIAATLEHWIWTRDVINECHCTLFVSTIECLSKFNQFSTIFFLPTSNGIHDSIPPFFLSQSWSGNVFIRRCIISIDIRYHIRTSPI